MRYASPKWSVEIFRAARPVVTQMAINHASNIQILNFLLSMKVDFKWILEVLFVETSIKNTIRY